MQTNLKPVSNTPQFIRVMDVTSRRHTFVGDTFPITLWIKAIIDSIMCITNETWIKTKLIEQKVFLVLGTHVLWMWRAWSSTSYTRCTKDTIGTIIQLEYRDYQGKQINKQKTQSYDCNYFDHVITTQRKFTLAFVAAQQHLEIKAIVWKEHTWLNAVSTLCISGRLR